MNFFFIEVEVGEGVTRAYSTLSISHVRKSDRGKYNCYARTWKSGAPISIMQVRIIGRWNIFGRANDNG